MFRILLIAAFVPAFVFATDFAPCDEPRPSPNALRVEGCELSPCTLTSGTDISFEFDFVSPFETPYVFPIVIALVGSENIPIELPEEKEQGCDQLIAGDCPLEENEAGTYAASLPILTTLPVGTEFALQFTLYDADESPVTCFRLNTVIG